MYGITKPISIAGPTKPDLYRNAELEKFLVDLGLNESKDETTKREEVLGRIDQIVPTKPDLYRNAELEKFLVDLGLNESKDETTKREEVLGRIDQIVPTKPDLYRNAELEKVKLWLQSCFGGFVCWLGHFLFTCSSFRLQTLLDFLPRLLLRHLKQKTIILDEEDEPPAKRNKDNLSLPSEANGR